MGLNKKISVSVLAVVLLAVSLGALWPISCSFGPPAVVGREDYSAGGTATFSHRLWAKVLKEVVNKEGLVRYPRLVKDHADLDAYILSINSAPFDDLSRDDKLAFLINAYNAFTVRLILDHYPIESIKDIPADSRWQGRKWNLAGRSLSLHQIEHEECRAKFTEPRSHFALNCASVGCPPLRPTPYTGASIDQQLEEQTRFLLNDKRWCQLSPNSKRLSLTKLMDWYKSDFLVEVPTLIAFIAPYRSDFEPDQKLAIDFMPYDWRLNEGR